MDRPVARPVLPLIFAAMAIFVITVVIGILNGLDVWSVPHGILLAHVHAGTLGWITLSVFAAAAWVFGAEQLPKPLVTGAIAAAAIYVVAFWADISILRPFAGTFMLIMMFWFAIWTFQQRRGEPLNLPKLSLLLAMINVCIGGILGVLLGLMLAGVIPANDGVAGAHPAMMVVGYLILAATGMAEQLVDGPGVAGLTTGAKVQAYSFFVAGIALAVGVLLDIMPLLGLNLLLEVVGVVLVLVRNRSRLANAGWGTSSPTRAGATAMLFLIPALGLLGYLIAVYAKDIESAPRGLLIGLDHITFIGILSNAIFGIILVAAAGAIPPAMDQIRYWGMNIGLVLFVIGLVAESPIFERIGTPIMGLAILHGLGTAAMRLRSGGGTPALDRTPAQT